MFEQEISNKILETKKNKGFTLVEMMIVLVILAIVAAIAIPVTLGIIDSSRQDDSKNMAKYIMNAVQSEFNQLAVDGELWYAHKTGKMGIILNKDRKIDEDGNECLFENEKEFKDGFINISRTVPVKNIFNRIEKEEDIVSLYVAAGNVWYYEFENEDDSERSKMYKAYVIVFKLKDDDKIYFYNGKEVSEEWPFDAPSVKADVKNKYGQEFTLKDGTKLQLYALRLEDGYECNTYWKNVVLPAVR
ncbi:MAG: prepilin-type N-terminal cleavage/methylation domain-containing protein [Lachnospiraceae bacterium]|nr:prepilin-type N-terminal cleavage/methylation domain-containing protein [Lachnospiraceae bacterium]